MVLLLGGLLLGATACGSDGAADDAASASSPAVSSAAASSPTASTAAAASPAASAAAPQPCSEVWAADRTLPKTYTGCLDGGDLVPADAFECSSGQVLVTYLDRYYAVLGGPVNDVGAPLDASRQYQSAWRSCTA